MVVAPTPTLVLNPVLPDYDDILSQIQVWLQGRDSWKEIITASTGETLTEMIAAVGAFNQLGLERAIQETFLDSAIQSTSILRIARMHGVHIDRKRPAQVTVQLTRTDGSTVLSIPAYTQWTVKTDKFFNRVPITFPLTVTQLTATLYQGEVFVDSYTSDGTDYQRFYIGSEDFRVSDDDIFATVDGTVIYSKTTLGLWHYATQSKVFYENTLPTGQVEVWFGNDIYATKPAFSKSIAFTYVLTNGSTANDAATGKKVAASGFTTVTGVTTSAILQGDDEKDTTFYKLLTPDIYSARRRMVTRRDHRAVTLEEYPGVIDAWFRGQAEINPGDVRWMNIVGVTLLTQTPWTQAQWLQFKNWAENRRAIATTVFLRLDPVSVPITVKATIYCFNRANLTSATNLVQQRVTDYFAHKVGSLGATYALSDLYDLIVDTEDDHGRVVDYVDITAPTQDIQLVKTEYATLVTPITLDAAYSARSK